MTTTERQDVDAVRDRVRTALRARLADHVTRLAWTADEVAAHQRSRLRALIAHALEASPFHARRLRGLDVEQFEVQDLERLPTMTKAEMMANLDGLLTDRRLNRAGVENHLEAMTDEPRLLLDDYVCLASGGSSGERGVFVQTVEEYADFVASLMRRRIAAAPASPMRGGRAIALVAAASPVHSTGFGAATSGGPVRLVAVPATLPLPELVDRLNAIQPPAVMGYPTKLAQLAAEQLAGHLRISPRSVTATSELLTEEDRTVITDAFGVPVVDQFASTEGLAGQSDPGRSIIAFASDMCIGELVDDDNRPVEAGVVASKVLVTNLHNFTQPLVRYELTDHFVAHAPDQGHLRASVEGRADSPFRYGGAVLHPLTVRTVMVKASTVREYQVRQTTRGIHIDAVTPTPFDSSGPIADLKQNLRDAGLDEPYVSFRVVDTINRNSRTGKTRRFIPLADD